MQIKEIRDILIAAGHARQQGLRTALATLVHVEGSSYRQPGARMLITENGELTGAISGGCLEGDALRKALRVIQQQQNALVTYDTSDEDDAKFGVGLGCNGIIQVLIEPMEQHAGTSLLTVLHKLTEDRGPAVLISLFSLHDKKGHQPGTCYTQKTNDPSVIPVSDPQLEQMLNERIQDVFSSRASTYLHYRSGDLRLTAFVEYIPTAISLIIAGGGNDVIPLVHMAGILGWDTTVIDGRPAYPTPKRFPAACKLLLAKPTAVLDDVNIDDQTAFLLMTHNYNYDMDLLKQLLKKRVSYIGILGPKKKWLKMKEELRDLQIYPDQEQLDSIYSPTGLDIGAEAPAEIALSVLAEIKAALNKRAAVPLKYKQAPIHQQQPIKAENIR